jgi:hypothetical protein
MTSQCGPAAQQTARSGHFTTWWARSESFRIRLGYTKESCSNRRENGKIYEMKSKRDKINKTKTTTTRRTRTANITEHWPNLFSFLFCASDHFNSKTKFLKFFKIPAKLLEDFPSETKGGLVGYVEEGARHSRRLSGESNQSPNVSVESF